MLQMERTKWAHLMAHTQVGDLWLTLEANMLGFTYHHNAFHNYWARLDIWYLFNAQQFLYFTLQITVYHSLTISDHALVCLTLNFGMPIDDLPLHIIRLMHINAAYFQHTIFKNMIRMPLPLCKHMHTMTCHMLGRPLCAVFSM